MALRDLFEPRESSYVADEIVGTFRSGEVKRGKPVALQAFRVTTVDEDTAETIAELFGGDPAENDSDKEPIQVYTNVSRVDVEFTAIDTSLKVFANNEFVRSCNGSVQTGGDHAGDPCPCAGLTLQERKDAKGGCKPSIEVTFRLKAAPQLGLFRFRSGSWSLLESVQAAEAKVDAAEGAPVPGYLAIEQVTTKVGRTLTLPRVVAK